VYAANRKVFADLDVDSSSPRAMPPTETCQAFTRLLRVVAPAQSVTEALAEISRTCDRDIVRSKAPLMATLGITADVATTNALACPHLPRKLHSCSSTL
jgi:hypothetical protein